MHRGAVEEECQNHQPDAMNLPFFSPQMLSDGAVVGALGVVVLL